MYNNLGETPSLSKSVGSNPSGGQPVAGYFRFLDVSQQRQKEHTEQKNISERVSHKASTSFLEGAFPHVVVV